MKINQKILLQKTELQEKKNIEKELQDKKNKDVVPSVTTITEPVTVNKENTTHVKHQNDKK